ncbi:hypothetical protein ADUPG1_010597 [Aduncisulcus paluster]|uniref:Uncharacterized protein n=1 Tax=Aduncisulcus paluster TaxID=2918883 RepID=A0ABQ5JS23_9EUKA|nr:hypothetical protein ADUPG1_010597 [Aduncisulcus paluster]
MQPHTIPTDQYGTPITIIGRKIRTRYTSLLSRGTDVSSLNPLDQFLKPKPRESLPHTQNSFVSSYPKEKLDKPEDKELVDPEKSVSPKLHYSETSGERIIPPWAFSPSQKTYIPPQPVWSATREAISMSKTVYNPYLGTFQPTHTMSTADHRIKPPILRDYNPRAFSAFVNEYQIYTLQGGQAPIEGCVVPDVWRLSFAYRAPEQQTLTGFALLQAQLNKQDGKSAYLCISKIRLHSPVNFRAWGNLTSSVTSIIASAGDSITPYIPAICREIARKSTHAYRPLGMELMAMKASGTWDINAYLYAGRAFLEEKHKFESRLTSRQSSESKKAEGTLSSGTEKPKGTNNSKTCRIHGAGHPDEECRTQHPELRRNTRKSGQHKHLKHNKIHHEAHFAVTIRTDALMFVVMLPALPSPTGDILF